MSMIPERYRPKLPPYWRENEVVVNHLEGAGGEIDYQRAKKLDLDRQMDIRTVTWGIVYWEYIFKVVPKADDSIETRRARVIAKFRKKNPFTPAEAIEQTTFFISPNGAGRIEVIENPSPGHFIISVPLRTLLDLPNWIEAIEKRKRVPHVFIPNMFEGGELQVSAERNKTYIVQEQYCGSFSSGGGWSL